MTKLNIDADVIKLHQEGLNDSEIAKIIKCGTETVRRCRLRNKLEPNFVYKPIYDRKQIYDLYIQGYNDYRIGEMLNILPSTIFDIRKREHWSLIKANDKLEIDEVGYQILKGTMLGDGSLKKTTSLKSEAGGKIEHCLVQKDFVLYKHKYLKNIAGDIVETSRYDERTSNTYFSVYFTLKHCKYLTKIYNQLYIKGRKTITYEYIKDIQPLGIAIWFMDDGCKTECSYSIATNCFSIEEINILQKWLKEIYNIDTNIHSKHILYIYATSKNDFTRLISPYIIECMKYKLHCIVPVKPLELQESLVVGNLQPISENTSITVSEQVQRLMGEEEVTNKPNTSKGQSILD